MMSPNCVHNSSDVTQEDGKAVCLYSGWVAVGQVVSNVGHIDIEELL